MARRKGRRGGSRTSTKIVRVGAAKPIIIRTPTPIVKKHHGGRRRGGAHALTPQRMFAVGVGGVVAGFADKQFGDRLPVVPLIGRKGVLAGVLYFVAKSFHQEMIRDAAIAAAAMAGYELGLTGKISGDDGGVRQV